METGCQIWLWNLLILHTFHYASFTNDSSVFVCPPCLCTADSQGCQMADCRDRNISEIPQTIPTDVCSLNLRENDLRIIDEDDFYNFTNLVYLDVSVCNITSVDEHAFNNLQELRHLNLSNNQLSFYANYTDSFFKALKRLVFLDISHNPCSIYPGEILKPLTSLKSLILDGQAYDSFGQEFENLKNLSFLKLSCYHDKSHSIPHLHNNTFDHLLSLQNVDVSYCNIKFIELGTFGNLANIKSLDLSGNRHIGFEGVENATYGLRNSTIRQLFINEVYGENTICVKVKSEHVQNLKYTNIEEIHASNNRIEVFEHDVFDYLPDSLRNVSIFSLRYARGSYLSQLHKLKGLSYLDLSGKASAFRNAPFTSYSPRYSIFPPAVTNSRDINSNSNDICVSPPFETDEVTLSIVRGNNAEVQPFHIPPNLTHFRYRYGALSFLLCDIHFAENKLQYVDLSSNIFTHWVGPITGFENITSLDLSNNIATEVSLDFFTNFSSLNHLNISRNLLTQAVIETDKGNLFQNLTNLKTLNASANDIHILNSSFLSTLVLLEEVDVSNNDIFTIDLNFVYSKSLNMINLSNNQIKWLAQKERRKLEDLSKHHKLHMDLTGNPLLCNCYNIDFIEWLLSPKENVVILNLENYFCLSIEGEVWYFNNTDILRKKLRQSCSTYFRLSMGVLTVVVAITSMIMSGIVYRYRWKIMYWYYVSKLARKKGNRDEEDADQFQCQAYISYSDEDIGFVRINMINYLENQRDLHLNIRDRDSVPGVAIAENIIDGIHNSKKTIILLTKNFLKSNWGHYEMNCAIYEGVLRKKGVVIFVMMDNVNNDRIPPETMYHMHSSYYMEYPQHEEGENVDLFWNDLTTAIMA